MTDPLGRDRYRGVRLAGISLGLLALLVVGVFLVSAVVETLTS